MLSEALPDLATLIDGGGKDYDTSKNLRFLLNNAIPYFRFLLVSMGKIVPTFFFLSMIVGSGDSVCYSPQPSNII